MKTSILLMLAVMLSGYSFGQDKGKLAFFSQDGKKFWVVINGEKMNKEPQYSVKDIPVDFQWGKAKIIFEDTNIPSIDKTVQVVDADGHSCNVKYMIRKTDKGKYVIRDIDAAFEIVGSSNNNSTTPNQTQTVQQSQPVQQTPSTTPQSQTNTQTFQQTTTVSDPNQNINLGVGVNVNETPTGVNVQMNVPGMQTSTQSAVVSHQVTTTTTTNEQPVAQSQVTMQAQPQPKPQVQPQPKPANAVPGYNGSVGCANPMSDADFQSAKSSITSKSFEDSKLTIAKQVTSSNCLLCSQVKEIMKSFNFESTRLEFAKYAYKYTYDKGNYFKLNDAFQFESSIDELNEYINGGN
jgi:hypothetical protein